MHALELSKLHAFIRAYEPMIVPARSGSIDVRAAALVVAKLLFFLHPVFVFPEAETHVGGLFTRGVRVTHA